LSPNRGLKSTATVTRSLRDWFPVEVGRKISANPSFDSSDYIVSAGAPAGGTRAQSRLNDQLIARGDVELQKTALLEKFHLFTGTLDGFYQNTSSTRPVRWLRALLWASWGSRCRCSTR